MSTLQIDPATTALLLIDLQHAIVSRDTQPHRAADVVARAAKLAAAFRQQKAPVIYVRVLITDMFPLPVDQPQPRDPNAPPLPANACDIVPEAGILPTDLLITKRQWGAFYDTGLDQQLRRRNIRTLVLGGIATNIGVESTARAAFDQGYALLLAEDATSSMTAEAHHFTIKNIFPRISRVRTTQEILASLDKP
jgi:nicotinamidase-related amidase